MENKLPFKDMDYLLVCSAEEEFKRFEQLLEKEEHFYSPLLFAKAAHELCAFKHLSLKHSSKEPQTPQDAKEIFSSGMAFGREYELHGNALILAQSATSKAVAKMLSPLYEVSFLEDFTLLSFCDARALFCAGFLLEASRRFHLVVGGGVEMAFVLLLADRLRAAILMRPMDSNITFVTTDVTAEIDSIFKKLSYTPRLYTHSIDLSQSSLEPIQNLMTEEKEQKGAAAAVMAYLATNEISQSRLIEELELLHYLR